MYLEDVCTIKRTDDGKYVVQVQPPRNKDKESKSNKMSDSPVMMEEPKTYVAADMAELCDLIMEHCDGEMTDDQKLDKGWKKK